MRDAHLDADIEALADGSLAVDAEARAHLDACPPCAARLEEARAIEALLASRAITPPPPGFTVRVMARVSRERWQVEQVVDIGFNLAVAAGLLLIVGGAAGLAWSAGLFTFDLDWRPLTTVASFSWIDRMVSQAQTVATAAILLTMALGLWWWAEADSSF